MSIVTLWAVRRVVASPGFYAVLLVCCMLAKPEQAFTQSIYKKVVQGFTDPTMTGRGAWVDLDNDNDLDLLYTGRTTPDGYITNVYENTGGTFTLRPTNLPGIQFGTFSIVDYDNDGDSDIVISGSSSFSDRIANLYRNDGGFEFTLQYSFHPLSNNDIAWFDADNDEDLDVIMAGHDGTAHNEYGTYVYINTGTGFTKVPNAGLPACMYCAIDCADANGDGRTDILMQGDFGTRLYLNNGTTMFREDVKSTFRPLTGGDVRWGDLDNDGDLDILVTGTLGPETSYAPYSLIYENRNGNSSHAFVERTDISLKALAGNGPHGIAWFDADNDGRQDILLTGSRTNRRYMNTGNGVFSEIQEAEFDPLYDMTVDMGDFDNDGDPDVAFAGYLTTSRPLNGYFTNTLRTGTAKSNTRPQPPSTATFLEKIYRREVRLQWGEGTDEETPATGLGYNFYLRSDTRKIVLPAVNFIDGHLLTENALNGYGRRGFVNTIPEGTLYYAVQSVDGGKLGSLFSAEKSFYHFNGPESVSATIVDEDDVKLTWLDHSTLETGYTVKRSTLAIGGFNDLATLAANATSYTDHFSFKTETPYYYRINAYNAGNASTYDSLVLVIAEPAINLKAQSVNGSKVNLTWKDQSKVETGFNVERRVEGGTFAVIATVPANTQAYTDASALPCTSYEYRVLAMTDNGSWPSQAIAGARTNCLPVMKDFAVSLQEDDSYTFTSVDFSTQFSDADAGSQFVKVTVRTLPAQGTMFVGVTAVQAGRDITLAELGTLRFTPARDFNGVATFTVQAHDETDYAALATTVTLQVSSVNDPPAFSVPEKEVREEDFYWEIQVATNPEYIPYEADNAVTYSLTPDISSLVNIAFDEASGYTVFTARKDQFGEQQFTLTANDGQETQNTFSRTFTIVITPVNDPPRIGAIPNIKAEVGAVIAPVQLDVTDVDNPVTDLFFTAGPNDEDILPMWDIRFTPTDDGHIQMTLKPGKQVGQTYVIVSASDGIQTDYSFFDVTFLPPTMPVVTDVEESSSRAWEVWPNPFGNEIHMTLQEESSGENEVALRDVLGRLLLRQSFRGRFTTLPTEDMAAGVYVLTITNAHGVEYQRRLVKQ